MATATKALDGDLALLFGGLPKGWQEKAEDLGALARRRVFPSAEVLLQVLLMHVAGGMSLRQTAVWAREAGLVSVSDVALQYRLGCAGEWLAWMTDQLAAAWLPAAAQPQFPEGCRVRYVDATCVCEPGPTGSLWRLHYAVKLPGLRADEVHLTDVHTGETFANFAVQAGDILVADAGYSQAQGVHQVRQQQGHVIVRLNPRSVRLSAADGRPFNLLRRLQRLGKAELGDWPAAIRPRRGPPVQGRICGVRLHQAAAVLARRKATEAAQKRGSIPEPATLKLADYLHVFTTLPAETLTTAQVLEFYRGRWQIELVFKRLKSLLEFGHLPKREDRTSQAWLQGKLLTAFLLQALRQWAEAFFPWSYPEVPPLAAGTPQPLLVARGIHAS
jgi:hypothetical protein